MKSTVFLLFCFVSAISFAASESAFSQTAAQGTPPPVVPPHLGQIDIANEPSVKVVSTVQPAVVNITAQGAVKQYFTTYDQFFRRYRGERSTPEQSIGSGLLVSPDGYVVTNAHVVELAEKTVAITLSSGSKYTAQIINTDEDRDLALLKIEDKTVQFPFYDLNYNSPNLTGETVFALGSPAGYQGSVSMGILSAKNRTFSVEGHVYSNLIQTDAAINPGNSGGPLVDLNGALVGINSAKLAGEAIESIGFAIPNDVVVPWVNDAIAVARGEKSSGMTVLSPGEALRQRYGFKLGPIDSEQADALGLDSGLAVTDVESNGPADLAGITAGMVVITIDNHQLTDEKSIPSELLKKRTGDHCRFGVVLFRTVGIFVESRGKAVTLVAR